jgi:hypothetical protein
MGCFLVSLDACTATKLSADSRIATAVPLDAAMKSTFNLDKLLNASANAAKLNGLDAGVTNTTSAETPEAPKVPDSVVLHVTLADGDDVLEVRGGPVFTKHMELELLSSFVESALFSCTGEGRKS